MCIAAVFSSPCIFERRALQPLLLPRHITDGWLAWLCYS